MSDTPEIDRAELLAKLRLKLNPGLYCPQVFLAAIDELKDSPDILKELESYMTTKKVK